MAEVSAKNYGVPTYRNTTFVRWWELLNEECTKLGLSERGFDDAQGSYEMGESPSSAAAQFYAMEI